MTPVRSDIDRQLSYMLTASRGPFDVDEFRRLGEVQRRHVVRTVAADELRESTGMQLRIDHLPDMELIELAERSRPPRQAQMSANPSDGGRAFFAAEGVPVRPLREATRDGAQPPHEVVAALDRGVPDDHEDRPAVDRLRRAGAALNVDQRDLAHALAHKHDLDGGVDVPRLTPDRDLNAQEGHDYSGSDAQLAERLTRLERDISRLS